MNFPKITMVLAAAAISMTGCIGGLDSACLKVVPVVSQGNTIINDAQDSLMQAEAAVQAIVDDASRQKALDAIAQARSALRVAESLLHSASEACTQPNLKGIFEAFSTAWAIVRTYLSTFGGAGVATVQDPVAYTIGAGK